MIYLASPYSHPDEARREERYNTALFVVTKMFGNGHLVFSPIVYTHPICIHGGYDFQYGMWEKFDRQMIELCNEFWILRMEGWEESKGIKAELAYANELGKKVVYV